MADWGIGKRCKGQLAFAGISEKSEVYVRQSTDKGSCGNQCFIVLESGFQSYRLQCGNTVKENGKLAVVSHNALLLSMIDREKVRLAAAREAARLAAIEARKLPAADMQAVQITRESTSLGVRLEYIDDIEMVLIGNPDGKWSVAALAEWSEGVPGTAEENLTSMLAPGDNLVVLALHNKIFSFGPGKWSYGFQLYDDAGDLWGQNAVAPGGAVGIRWWKPLVVTRGENDRLKIQVPNPDLVASLVPKMNELHEFSIQRFGVEISMGRLLIQEATTALVSGLTAPAPSVSGNGAEEWMWRRDNPSSGGSAWGSGTRITPIGGEGGLHGCANPPCW